MHKNHTFFASFLCNLHKDDFPKKIFKKRLTFGINYAIIITERKERGNKNDKNNR